MMVRIVAALAILGCLSAPAVAAGIRDDMAAGAARCTQIPDDRLFLECYYGAAQPMRAHLGLPPAPDSQQKLVMAMPALPAMANTPQAALPAAQDSTGFFSGLFNGGGSGKVSPDIVARITDYKFDQVGAFTVTLSNGQVWRQFTGDTIHALWNKSPSKFAYDVVITHGSMGSYVLRVKGQAGGFHVERVS